MISSLTSRGEAITEPTHTVEKEKAVDHLKYLDGMRAVAALYVVLHHAKYYLPDLSDASSVSLYIRLIIFLTSYGHYAVTVFIVLSGFCLMLPVARRGDLAHGAINFFKKRAIRILPPYFITLLLSLLLIKTILNGTGIEKSIWTRSLPVTAQDITFHLFLIHDIFSSTSDKINYILWSIAVEWRIYFLFPIVISLRKKFRFAPIILMMVVSSYSMQWSLQFTILNSEPAGMCVHYVGLFGLGMLACDIAWSMKRDYEVCKNWAWGKISFLMFCLNIVLITRGHQNFYLTDFAVALWVSLLLIHLTRGPQGITHRLLSSRILSSLGLFSYSIYLCHPFILQIVKQYLVYPQNGTFALAFQETFFVGFLVVIFTSYLFYLCFERPFIMISRNLSSSSQWNGPKDAKQ